MTEAAKTTSPVFADQTGRRRRLIRAAGVAIACVLVAYLAVMAFGLVSGTAAPLTPWPAGKPPPGAALPHRNGTPSGHATPRLSPTRRAATSTPTARPANTPRSGKATTRAARPGRGHAYGLTKSQRPKGR